MDDAHSDQRQAGALERFSKHPIWAPIGALGTVAGVGIAIYTYVATQQQPAPPAAAHVATQTAEAPPETRSAPLAAPPAAQPPSAPAPAQVAQTAPSPIKTTESPAESPSAPKTKAEASDTASQTESAKADARQVEPPPEATPDPLPEPKAVVREPAHDMPLRPLETPTPKSDGQDASQDIEIASRSDPGVPVPMYRAPQRETRAAAPTPAQPRSINVLASEAFSLCGHGPFRAQPSALGILLENQDRSFPFRRQGTLAPWTYRVTSAAPVQVFPGCVATFKVQTSHGAQYVAVTEQPNQTGH